MEPLHLHRGFTLIELLVVLTIIVSIMGVIFTGQGSFNNTFILSNTAYDVALSFRDAETYGLASRASGALSNAGYGLHFQKSPSNQFTFYGDTSPAASCSTPDCQPGDHIYTSGSDALVRTYTLGNGLKLYDMCVYTTSWNCTFVHNGATGTLTTLDVTFARPNPVPYLSPNGVYSAQATQACFAFTSPFGNYRYVSVSTAGQISANTASCP
jgi:prepilin-type N-terminal cleavage/methylation domain-containing protein